MLTAAGAVSAIMPACGDSTALTPEEKAADNSLRAIMADNAAGAVPQAGALAGDIFLATRIIHSYDPTDQRVTKTSLPGEYYEEYARMNATMRALATLTGTEVQELAAARVAEVAGQLSSSNAAVRKAALAELGLDSAGDSPGTGLAVKATIDAIAEYVLRDVYKSPGGDMTPKVAALIEKQATSVDVALDIVGRNPQRTIEHFMRWAKKSVAFALAERFAEDDEQRSRFALQSEQIRDALKYVADRLRKGSEGLIENAFEDIGNEMKRHPQETLKDIIHAGRTLPHEVTVRFRAAISDTGTLPDVVSDADRAIQDLADRLTGRAANSRN